MSAGLSLAPTAQAQVAPEVVNVALMLPASAAALASVSCHMPAGIAGTSAFTPAAAASPFAQQTKSAALNGNGTMTALERMIQAQSGQASAAAVEAAYGKPVQAPAQTASAMPVSLLGLSNCLGQSEGRLVNVMPALAETRTNRTQGATDFLASKRISIGKTHFEADWQRVSRGSVSKDWANRRLGALQRSDADIISAVNAYANKTIRYAEDRDLWGKADYWANAKTTFRLGKGDCEDIAIAKMQMLAALGIKRDDMVLTLAKDLVRRVDHAVLIVRVDGRFVMLDNTTDKLIDASVSQGYRPVLSFGNKQSWLHGY
ncbi:hypothetical protein GRI44_08315 [Altererythrobacter confluentis]|uniref:Transglutaminase-like cysteine proteinase BTLCP n=1 Tax=Allopontixanthobacter confluentis TaxID=1849021 RepID=A0A6L7GF96_9SPHN|nr:transglutaminase-like cysteine peptidase [Allopontixanthobacter confluentis]MXP14752.1 hypothetical protein [Allopontixanthobacter confluentis]